MKYVATATRDEVRLRYRIFALLVLGLLGVLALRLGQMQLLEREKYAVEAEGNAIETKIVRPARGYIFDRNGTLLVDNETTLSITLAPRQFDPANLPLVAELLGVPLAEVRRDYETNLARSRYQTFTLRTNVPFDAFARLRENQFRLPGLGFEESQQRRYHGEARLSHVLGYVREISEEQLARRAEEGYRMGDMVGITGVEKEYETILRGRVGRELVLVNVHGMEVQPYEGGAYDVPPESSRSTRACRPSPRASS
jgi:penicillin-binding protein 2